eukprot:6069137-Heterocapsa_arctica.AAC.1
MVVMLAHWQVVMVCCADNIIVHQSYKTIEVMARLVLLMGGCSTPLMVLLNSVLLVVGLTAGNNPCSRGNLAQEAFIFIFINAMVFQFGGILRGLIRATLEAQSSDRLERAA